MMEALGFGSLTLRSLTAAAGSSLSFGAGLRLASLTGGLRALSDHPMDAFTYEEAPTPLAQARA